jgi:hypothetical protein
MPSAEYNSVMDLTVEQVRNLAMTTAAKMGKQYWVFVTQSAGQALFMKKI